MEEHISFLVATSLFGFNVAGAFLGHKFFHHQWTTRKFTKLKPLDVLQVIDSLVNSLGFFINIGLLICVLFPGCFVVISVHVDLCYWLVFLVAFRALHMTTGSCAIGKIKINARIAIGVPSCKANPKMPQCQGLSPFAKLAIPFDFRAFRSTIHKRVN